MFDQKNQKKIQRQNFGKRRFRSYFSSDKNLIQYETFRSGYDVVGGGVNTNESCTSGFAGKMKSKTFYDSNEGICWTRESGHHGQWEAWGFLISLVLEIQKNCIKIF